MADYISRCIVTGASKCPKNPQAKANKVFIAMPFRDVYTDLYSVIREVLVSLGYEPYRADLDFDNATIACKVCFNVQEAKYILCEISDWNPNVLLELGLALGLNRYALLLRELESSAPVPTDLTGIEYIEYSRYKLTTDFKNSLYRRLLQVKTKGYEYNPYLGNHKYRTLRFNLSLNVEQNGDTKTKYDICLQKISYDKDKEPIKFKMPYHDTPNQKTPLDVFNIKARMKNKNRKLGVNWILGSNVWKRFNIVLPPLSFEQTHDFEVTMFEKSLFTKDEEEDFYDVVFYYPVEKATIEISFPWDWDFAEEKLVIGETGEVAPCIITKNRTRTGHSNLLSVQIKEPVVNLTYLIIWKWLSNP